MEVVLIDTDVVSFLFKGDSRISLYQSHLQNKVLAISFMTVAELYYWAYTRDWGQRRIGQLEAALRKYVVLPLDLELCKRWAEIRSVREVKGSPISVQDAWIAAAALRYEIPLVTHNVGDFGEIKGLTVISRA